MTQEQVDQLVSTILLEKKGWAQRLPLVREEMARYGITSFEVTVWLRERGVRTGRGPISQSSVARILRGDYPPDADAQDAIVDMLVAASLGNWSKGRFLSWNRVADAIRPIRPPRILRRLALLPVAAVLLALVPMPAQAQTTLAWAPGGIGMGASSPVYSQPFHIIDAMAGTLSDDHRRIWVNARNAALTNWDIPFTVERIPESSLAYTWTTENINGGLAITDIVPGAILLVRMRTDSGQDCAGWNAELRGGIAAFSPWNTVWWKDYWFKSLVGVIGHELGHTLGFGHGGTGIMYGNDKPNAEELAALHAYWG